MERRLVLAIVLALLVWFVPLVIWPPKPAPRPPADSAAVRDSAAQASSPERPTAQPPIRPSADTCRIVWVTSPLYRLGFSTHGGTLRSAELLQYQSFAPGDAAQPVNLVPPGGAFLRHRLVLPADRKSTRLNSSHI